MKCDEKIDKLKRVSKINFPLYFFRLQYNLVLN